MRSMGKGLSQGKRNWMGHLGAGTQLQEYLLQSDTRGKYSLIFPCSDKFFQCVLNISQPMCSCPGTRNARDWNEMSRNIHYLQNLEADQSWFGNSHKIKPSQFHLILSYPQQLNMELENGHGASRRECSSCPERTG